jgi:hypothetical protein
MLFTERSLWTMIHGILLAGGSLLALAAALFAIMAMLRSAPDETSTTEARWDALAWLTGFIAVTLWVTVLTGTYVIFPSYREAPPAGMADLTAYPRSLLLSNPGTRWLHTFAMESKEHMPWIAAMLATAVAFVTARYRSTLAVNAPLRSMVTMLLAACFAIVAFTGLMGVLVNKVAPLE